MLYQQISYQADVQVVVRTLCSKVQVSLAILAEVNTRARLVAIKAEVQVRSTDARHNQASECQKK
jgi:hypothetical protein